jgi:hypothetical protein
MLDEVDGLLVDREGVFDTKAVAEEEVTAGGKELFLKIIAILQSLSLRQSQNQAFSQPKHLRQVAKDQKHGWSIDLLIIISKLREEMC